MLPAGKHERKYRIVIRSVYLPALRPPFPHSAHHRTSEPAAIIALLEYIYAAFSALLPALQAAARGARQAASTLALPGTHAVAEAQRPVRAGGAGGTRARFHRFPPWHRSCYQFLRASSRRVVRVRIRDTTAAPQSLQCMLPCSGPNGPNGRRATGRLPAALSSTSNRSVPLDSPKSISARESQQLTLTVVHMGPPPTPPPRAARA